MKKMYSRLRAPDLTRELIDAGILSGEAQDAATSPAPTDVLIRQVGGVVESSAFDLDCGHGTGYILPLHVAVDLPRFKIYGWRLDLPWEDPQFHWLTDPLEYSSGEAMYQFSPTLKYSRAEVINHRHVLQRGRGLEGLLLGLGFESVPDLYRHGSTVNAHLLLIDEMNREFPTEVQLWVDRSARIDRKPTKATAKKRGKLFDKPDFEKVEIIQS
jgi:hypothetical protein